LLRDALKRQRVPVSLTKHTLPGRPDLVFARARVVVFVDGDYWHGRRWAARKRKLAQGANAAYWINKIEGNRKRDRLNNRRLREVGWTVLRFWETDIAKRADAIAHKVAVLVVPTSRMPGRDESHRHVCQLGSSKQRVNHPRRTAAPA
jgi:DNA mismatch endonuclease (patch repair protein)